ncbi:MAG: hypothetical protein KGL97_14860 [Alphaproteobacteria bacterium]|nr:hypothetical protein [Alphaproteobacteria bacterium]
MIKEVVLLVESPFVKRDYDRFGVELIEKYFKVRVFDLTPWINPHFWAVRRADQVHHLPGYTAINSFSDLKSELDSTNGDLFIDYLSAKPRAEKTRKELKLRYIPRVAVAWGLLPLPNRNLAQRLTALWRYRTHRHIVAMSWVHRYFSALFRTEVPPEFLVLTGAAGLELPSAKLARHIWTHTTDYDTYLSLRDLPVEGRRPYAVYIDEDCAYHTDFIHDHIRPFVTAEKFYPALMQFFKSFEERTGLEVAIAAHPRSRWDIHSELLAGRTPEYGRTAELIRSAKLAFTHASTSISFAVLYQVPLVFLTSNEMEDSLYREEVRLRKDYFGAPLVNIDKTDDSSYDLRCLETVNATAYDAYRELYVKKIGTPELPSWEVFARRIREL